MDILSINANMFPDLGSNLILSYKPRLRNQT